MVFDAVHDLRHRVLLHFAAHQELQVILARDLPGGGGEGAKGVGVHCLAALKLCKVGDFLNHSQNYWDIFPPKRRGMRGFYLLHIAASVNGKRKGHFVTGDLGSAARVRQVHVVAIIAERAQVTPADHNGHVV